MYSDYVDLKGNPIERTPNSHPYSYDPYVVFKLGEEKEATTAVYSDRIRQWDYQKTKDLEKKYFKDTGDYYTNRNSSDIQSYLRERFDSPDLKLIYMLQGCNVSNGYPYWIFGFKS